MYKVGIFLLADRCVDSGVKLLLLIHLTHIYLVAIETEDGKGGNYYIIHSSKLLNFCLVVIETEDGKGGNYYTIHSSYLLLLGCHGDGRW